MICQSGEKELFWSGNSQKEASFCSGNAHTPVVAGRKIKSLSCSKGSRNQNG